MTKGDGVMDEGRQSSITRVTRRSLRTSVQFGKELVGRFISLTVDFVRKIKIHTSFFPILFSAPILMHFSAYVTNH